MATERCICQPPPGILQPPLPSQLRVLPSLVASWILPGRFWIKHASLILPETCSQTARRGTWQAGVEIAPKSWQETPRLTILWNADVLGAWLAFVSVCRLACNLTRPCDRQIEVLFAKAQEPNECFKMSE